MGQWKRWEFIEENKKVRKDERKNALDQESDQENDQEKGKIFRYENSNQIYFPSHIIVLSFVDLIKLNISKK